MDETGECSPAAAPVTITVAVFAKNEAGNVGPLVRRLLNEAGGGCVETLHLVAEGCTDGTEQKAAEAAAGDPRLRCSGRVQAAGKWWAIRRFLHDRAPTAGADAVTCLLSADVLPGDDALAMAAARMAKSPIPSALGFRVIPLNPPRGFGRVVHVLWAIHHVAALCRERAGEGIVLKGAFEDLPEGLIADEPALCEWVRQRGGVVQYEPGALLFNLGPSNAGEYLARRRSIAAGFLQLRRRGLCPRYTVVQWWPIAGALGRWMVWGSPVGRWPVVAACGLELCCRLLGWLDGTLGRADVVWRPAPSTKTPAAFWDNRKASVMLQEAFIAPVGQPRRGAPADPGKRPPPPPPRRRTSP